MTTYARVQNGVVMELFTPPNGLTIAQCFASGLASQFVAVPSGTSPSQGWTYANGTFAAPAAASPTVAQKAAAALAAGLAVTSTGTPALNATYAVDDRTATNITGILAANANGISVAAQIAEWPDITGTPHNFSWTNYANLVSAILTYRAALQPLIAGAPGSLPAATATIA